ncbi:MAG TPA: arsenate reductase (glutaredoxin), partial [Caulobacter sp.]
MSNADFPVVIFHNPACGTSRNVVAMVEAAGYAPQVVEYLKAGWTREQLRELAGEAGLSLRALMREKGTPAAELGLL